MNIVILGPQGSGKGTQATALRDQIGVVHIASGDVLREARQSQTELGRIVRRHYDAGELVPDEITIRLLLDAIHSVPADADVLLDGFPRTLAQAVALDGALAQEGERIDLVLELVAPLKTVKERLLGRVICRTCGAVYNTRTRPPLVEGRCDIDGGELYQREDDYPEAIETRLAIWAEQNRELVEYYGPRGVLVKVDADRPPEVINADLIRLIQARRAV